MALKNFTLTAAALIALTSASFAANTTTGTSASKATTEVEKAVGAGDTLSATDLKSAVKLGTLKDAKDKLATAKVDDPMGNIIGPVKDVVTGKTGAPTAIHVDVGGWLGVGERVVSINAGNFTYIPSRDILLTKMSKADIQKLPAVKQKS
ncbi:MAG TPA: PRC-barrel domain-containing protein [Micropepsaceae bacterium]